MTSTTSNTMLNRQRTAGFLTCSWLLWLAAISLLTLPGCRDASENTTQSDPPPQEFAYQRLQMGMPVDIVIWADGREAAETAAKAAFEQVAEIDRLMNHYDRHSELNRINRAAAQTPTVASEHVFHVLQRAAELHALTSGAFDPTAGPVIAVWRAARQAKRLPDPDKLRSAQRRVGMQHVNLDSQHRTVLFTTPNIGLDLGAIAKGYACDRAAEALRAADITCFSIRIGGDMVVGAAPPGSSGWTVRVPRPAAAGPDALELANTAISISGDTQQFFELDGVHYSHVVDPRTGQAVTSRQMALVTGPHCTDTDALATAGCVMAPDAFQRVLADLPEVHGQVWVVADAGGGAAAPERN
jgi:thiamine biosynthesis lipoprotein